MPRKAAINTKLMKYAATRTLAGMKRMSASSKKRIKKLYPSNRKAAGFCVVEKAEMNALTRSPAVDEVVIREP
jgi:hypothetical protein